MTHDFYVVNEETAEALFHMSIHDAVIDYIDEQIGASHNLFYSVPTMNPCYAKLPVANALPNQIGFSYTGLTIVNAHCVDGMERMIQQWLEVINALRHTRYYYHLASVPQDELHQLTSKELEVLKECYFDKAVICQQLTACLEHLPMLKEHYILRHEGI